jgi:hypothetical protein
MEVKTGMCKCGCRSIIHTSKGECLRIKHCKCPGYEEVPEEHITKMPKKAENKK